MRVLVLVAAGWKPATPPSSDPAPRGARGQGEVPSQCLVSRQYLPLCPHQPSTSVPRIAAPLLPSPPRRRGPLGQPSTPLCACQTRPSSPQCGMLDRRGGGRSSDVGPSLSKTQHRARPSRLLLRLTTTPGHLRKRTRDCPLRQHPRRPRAPP